MSLGPAQVIGSLRECFRDGLPRYTLDARYQSLASRAVAAQGPDTIRALPYFWQKSAATTIIGCRLVRGIGCATQVVPRRWTDFVLTTLSGCGNSMEGKKSLCFASDRTLSTSSIFL